MIGGPDAAGMTARLTALEAVYDGDLTVPATDAGVAAKRDATIVGIEVARGRLSHMGKRGTRLTSGFEVTNEGRRITMALRPAGAWVILQRGASGHAIGPKRARVRRAKGHPTAIHAASYAHPARRVHHPGTGGKQAITRTFGRMRTTIVKSFHDAQVAQLRRIYG